MEKIVQTGGLTGAELCKLLAENSPQLEAIEALKKDLALPDLTLNTSLPLHGDHYSDLNLVTTTENLADEWEDDAATYAAQGCFAEGSIFRDHTVLSCCKRLL